MAQAYGMPNSQPTIMSVHYLREFVVGRDSYIHMRLSSRRRERPPRYYYAYVCIERPYANDTATTTSRHTVPYVAMSNTGIMPRRKKP